MNFSSRIHQSLARNPGIESKFLTLATINLKKELPSCRTVVFRDFLNEKNLVLYTDSLSRKVKELQENSNVEICWYFRDTREQYRIRGSCTILDDLDYRKHCWSKMTQSSKELYLLAANNDESEHFVSDESSVDWNEEGEKKAFDRFTILVVEPDGVEYLDLRKKNAASGLSAWGGSMIRVDDAALLWVNLQNMPGVSGKFNAAKGSRAPSHLEEKQWIHRIANELRANRQWTQKWKILNDATLYSDEKGPKYPQKLATTSWSEWSVLNPPDPGVIVNKKNPKSIPHFKITGNRDKYLSNNKPSESYSKQDPIIGLADIKSKPKPSRNIIQYCPVTSNREYGYFWGTSSLEKFSTTCHK